MKPFDPDSSCIKCGSMAARSLFLEGGTFEPARILRTCVRCAYQWDETPLDEVPAAEPRPGGNPHVEGIDELVVTDLQRY